MILWISKKADRFMAAAAVCSRLVSGILFLVLATASAAYADSRPQGFSGDLGLGASSSTGTSQALNISTQDALYWLRGPWSNDTHLSYNYSRSDGVTSADRLAVANQTKFRFAAEQYAFGNIGYVRNRFDGYYYRLDETAGYGHYLHFGRDMRLALETGIGARESHRIGGIARVAPIARFNAAYRWQFSKAAKLEETLDAVVAAYGGNTYESVLAVDSPLYGALGMRFSFTATYNTQTQPGYRHFNTLTAVNLVYHF
jgi:putative salt-induced outer membrane protein